MQNTFPSFKRSRPLLGTFVEMTVEGDDATAAHDAINDAFDVIAWVQKIMNVHDSESELSLLHREAYRHPVRVSSWTYDVLQKAQRLSLRTRGSFDVTTTDAADFHAVELLPDQCVRFGKRGLRMDLSGIAKGYAVDRACDRLKDHGVHAALVNAGGDMRAIGERSFQIYVRHAGFPSVCFMTIPLRDASLCNSAKYFGSAFRAKDQQSQDEILACGVRTKDCVSADALTKVLMHDGECAASVLEDYAAEAYLVKQGHSDQFHLWCYGKPWL